MTPRDRGVPPSRVVVTIERREAVRAILARTPRYDAATMRISRDGFVSVHEDKPTGGSRGRRSLKHPGKVFIVRRERVQIGHIDEILDGRAP